MNEFNKDHAGKPSQGRRMAWSGLWMSFILCLLAVGLKHLTETPYAWPMAILCAIPVIGGNIPYCLRIIREHGPELLAAYKGVKR